MITILTDSENELYIVKSGDTQSDATDHNEFVTLRTSDGRDFIAYCDGDGASISQVTLTASGLELEGVDDFEVEEAKIETDEDEDEEETDGITVAE